MKKLHLLKKGLARRLMRTALASFVLVAIVGTSFGLDIPRAQAGLLVTEDGGNWWTNIATTIEQTVDTVADVALKTKDIAWDKVAWYIAKQAVQQIQKATVRWIQSGFDGSPAFVQDLGGFLQDNADRLAGEFIYGSDLKALCSPFQLNIRIALSIKYLRKDPPARCTLSGVVGNVENFLAGSFAEGGLPGWFELTVNPNNNFFGASAAAESALLGKLGKKREVDLNKLIFGKGFLGKEECSITNTVQDADIEGNEFTRDETKVCGSEVACKRISRTGSKISCKTVTPGDTISAALNVQTSAGTLALIEADEINEIISALFQQLAVQMLTGARGLLGTGERGVDGTPAFLDQINNPQFDTWPGQTTVGEDFMSEAIKSEQQYRDLYAAIVSRADALLARITELEALDGTETDEGRWECQSFDGIRAQVTALRAPALAKQIASDKNLATLNALQSRYATAIAAAPYSTAAAEESLRIIEEFIALESSGVLHRASSIPEHERATEPIIAQIRQLASQAESMCRLVPKNGRGDDDGDSDSE